MPEKNGKLIIDWSVRDSLDENTGISVSKTPMRGKAGEFKNYRGTHEICGVCGKNNTKLIHHTGGGTSDGTVDIQEIQCLDCGCFTEFYFSDRM